MSRSRMYTDADLNALGDVFVAARLDTIGMTFEEFLEGPDLVVTTQMRGQQLIEPMHHHRWAKRSLAACNTKEVRHGAE